MPTVRKDAAQKRTTLSTRDGQADAVMRDKAVRHFFAERRCAFMEAGSFFVRSTGADGA
jgi:hypothetical protein